MYTIKNDISINAIHRRYGIYGDLLTVLWTKYKQFEKESIRKTYNIRANYEFKRKIVLDIESGRYLCMQIRLNMAQMFLR